MLKLGEMRWSYAFSYGPDNKINFSNYDLLQLVGRNGHGKSSIALILEEVLYNKNSKGVKKAKILNRYARAKSYTIELDFTKDSDSYSIKTVRGSTQSVKLTKNGDDISSHTSTGTYKLIEEIIGFDHKTFAQIVYQSNAFSLEFLTATDTSRKKFLIELLKLTKYSEALEYFKEESKELTKELELLNTKLKITSAILTKYPDSSLVLKQPVPVPEVNRSHEDELATIQEQLKNITKTNSKIIQNNKYKEILAGLSLPNIAAVPADATPLKIQHSEVTKRIAVLKKNISGSVVPTHCPTCKQPVDNSHKVQILNDAKAELVTLQAEEIIIKNNLEVLEAAITAYNGSVKAQAEWEKYYGLIDNSLATKILDSATLTARSEELTKLIADARAANTSAIKTNADISAHNARVEVITQQLDTAKEESTVLSMHIADTGTRLTNIQVLVKTFGTSGLVAYKIECLVEDLEDLTNKYLQEMSDGRFQLMFKISASDKLDVIINDNGNDIDINALSTGERARVNVATLLAIRKLMQALSNSRTNLLILDETVENLDAEGKEKLIEVLLEEESLNTFLISHGFSHPLLEKLYIVKENNISRIE